MLFNSLEYALFLPLVFCVYWAINHKLKLQNLFLLVVSYIFYGWWDWRFLSLIVLSSCVDYIIGQQIYKADSQSRKKVFLGISLFVNLGLLFVFKYYNFFIDSWIQAWSNLGIEIGTRTISLILPVGISFYTFQTLSYSIDIFRGKLKPSEDVISFFAFVSFFPQLVAGPIERANNLLPQFLKKREFNLLMARAGLRQILWGLFKKVVIADNCAIYVNDIFLNYESLTGSELFLGAFYFSFQIYCDFSGYSDIAIGTAKLFGFKLMTNFRFPYFSRDIAEFWRRWHISLSTWFRDYLYIPLGGSKGGKWKTFCNTMIIFVVSGFWHGANWTFIFWGFFNGLLFLPLMLSGQNRKYLNTVAGSKYLPSVKEFLQISFTFLLTTLAWIFFRAQSIFEAFDYLGILFSMSLFIFPPSFKGFLPLIFLFLIAEWLLRNNETYSLKKITWRPLRWSIYTSVVFMIGYFSPQTTGEFIYFQF